MTCLIGKPISRNKFGIKKAERDDVFVNWSVRPRKAAGDISQKSVSAEFRSGCDGLRGFDKRPWNIAFE